LKTGTELYFMNFVNPRHLAYGDIVMALKKSYVKSKNICRVTFSIPSDAGAQEIFLVGDFNAWDCAATPMKKGKQAFSATLDLETGREYEFRYLLDGRQWQNDDAADKYHGTPFPDAQNSVVVA